MEPINKSGVINMMNFVVDKTLVLAKENTVLGERIDADGMTIIPISKVSVSFAGGGADLIDAKKRKKSAPAGGGAKVDIEPLSCIVIKDGRMSLMSVDLGGGATGKEIINTVIESAKALLSKKNKDK